MDRQTKTELDALQVHLDRIHQQLSECFAPGYDSKNHIHMVVSELSSASDDFIENSSSSSYIYAGKKLAKLAVINFKMRQIARACFDDANDIALSLRNEILTSIVDPTYTDSLEAA